jgi:hypothetical protein
MLKREKQNVFQNHFDHGEEFMFIWGSSMMRAIAVDKLFSLACNPEINITDKGVLFQAISLLDNAYDKIWKMVHPQLYN